MTKARQLIEGRDDVSSLPLPATAKRYARRCGLKAMMRQPEEFQAVNAMITNPTKPDRKFHNYDYGEIVKHAIKS